MKFKNCEICSTEISTAYRVKIAHGKIRIFVCGPCFLQSKKGDFYTYGGTWKAKKK